MSAFSLLSFQGLNHISTVEIVCCQSSHIAHLVWRFGILGQFNFCRRNKKCVSHCLYSASTVVPYTIFKSFVLKQVWVCWFHQWRTSKPVTTLRAIGQKHRIRHHHWCFEVQSVLQVWCREADYIGRLFKGIYGYTSILRPSLETLALETLYAG